MCLYFMINIFNKVLGFKKETVNYVILYNI